MIAYFWVAIGGALGSMGRYWLGGLIAEAAAQQGRIFPWNTLVVNVTGSFVIGVFGALTTTEGRWPASPAIRQFFVAGICGGYTTFSSFSLQTLNLLQDRQWLPAGANACLSVVLCLIAVWLGYLLGAMFNSMKGS